MTSQTATPARTVTYRGEPHEATWFGINTDGVPVVEIRPTGRRAGITQTVLARDVDCPDGCTLADSCPICDAEEPPATATATAEITTAQADRTWRRAEAANRYDTLAQYRECEARDFMFDTRPSLRLTEQDIAAVWPNG